MMKFKFLNPQSWIVQLVATALYIQCLVGHDDIPAAQDQNYDFAIIGVIVAFAIKLAITIAISMAVGYLTAKKPPKPRYAQPVGLEQFSVPTAEEGRSIQVLFGKRYIAGPNVVWYGDLKSDPIVVRV